MQIFAAFLRQRIKTILLFLLFGGIFATVFSLYGLPVVSVGYASAICAFIGLVVIIIDYVRYCAKHRRLQALERKITITDDGIPAAADLLEEDYQAALRTLYADKLQLTDAMSSRYQDLVDYYTVWAHQIKTPIAAMRLLLQSEGKDSPHSRELNEELQRIEQYVEMVMCYLRLDAGSTDYVIRETDLDSIIKQAVRSYAGSFIRKKIRLEYEPLNYRVVTDEKWLLFVVEQVLSNALKYTKSGCISITMIQPGLLRIHDTGIGIAPEDVPRIFEKGFTGYNGRTNKKASGIGLYLCRRICTNLGHTITASSVVGSGTDILIRLDRPALETE